MLRASKVRTSKSKSPYARPPTRGAVVASRASTRMPNVTSSSSGPSTVAVTESTGRIYDRSQSSPVPVVQPTVQPVLDRARAPSDQTVEHSVAGSSTNTEKFPCCSFTSQPTTTSEKTGSSVRLLLTSIDVK